MMLTIALIAVAFLIVINAYKDREIFLLQERVHYISKELNLDNTLLSDVVQAHREYGVENPIDGDKEKMIW